MRSKTVKRLRYAGILSFAVSLILGSLLSTIHRFDHLQDELSTHQHHTTSASWLAALLHPEDSDDSDDSDCALLALATTVSVLSKANPALFAAAAPSLVAPEINAPPTDNVRRFPPTRAPPLFALFHRYQPKRFT